jgi:hypothetical protein
MRQEPGIGIRHDGLDLEPAFVAAELDSSPVTECPLSRCKLSRLHPTSGIQFSFFDHVFLVLLSLDQILGCPCRNSFSSACQQR